MKFFCYLFFLCQCCFAADYDCVFIGTSPIPLFEALYQHALGKKVLILEADQVCGGAWKSVNVCNIENADLGCHQIGKDPKLRNFLEKYAGCQLIALDQTNILYDPEIHKGRGFYFSNGCYELIHNLQKMIANTSISIQLNSEVESVEIDSINDVSVIHTKDLTFTTKKIFITPFSYFRIDGGKTLPKKTKFYHLYLLIADSTPPKFGYLDRAIIGTSRIVNLSHMTKIADSGRQLIVLQTSKKENLDKGELFLEELKQKDLIDSTAILLCTETCEFEQWPSNSIKIKQLPPQHQKYFELLETFHISRMTKFIPKWESILTPYSEIVRE